MPFNTGSSRRFTVESFNGASITLSGGASTLYVVDLPKLTTHISVQMPTGTDPHVYSVYMQPGQAGVTVTPSDASLVLDSGTWYTIPLVNLDRPQFGFSIHADDVVLHAGTVTFKVSPEIDPIVATMRGR